MKYAVEVFKQNGIFEDRTKTEVFFVNNGVELHKLLIDKTLVSISSTSEIKGKELESLLEISEKEFERDFKLKKISSIDGQIKQLEDLKKQLENSIQKG